MQRNPRFKCRACWKWCIRRATRRTLRVAYCPELTKLCIDCAYSSKAAKPQAAKRRRKRKKAAPMGRGK